MQRAKGELEWSVAGSAYTVDIQSRSELVGRGIFTPDRPPKVQPETVLACRACANVATPRDHREAWLLQPGCGLCCMVLTWRATPKAPCMIGSEKLLRG